MAFDFYLNISRTAVEIIAIGVLAGVIWSIVDDMIDEKTVSEETTTEV